MEHQQTICHIFSFAGGGMSPCAAFPRLREGPGAVPRYCVPRRRAGRPYFPPASCGLFLRGGKARPCFGKGGAARLFLLRPLFFRGEGIAFPAGRSVPGRFFPVLPRVPSLTASCNTVHVKKRVRGAAPVFSRPRRRAGRLRAFCGMLGLPCLLLSGCPARGGTRE